MAPIASLLLSNSHINQKSITIDNDLSFKLVNKQLVTEMSEGAISTRCNISKQKNVLFSREIAHINPLVYDDFERYYNSEDYFNVYGNSKKKEDKYNLRLTDSSFIPCSISSSIRRK